MFVEACAKAMQFTRPMVISTAHVDGTVDSGFGAYTVINREGWAITAAHCVHTLNQIKMDAEKMREVDAYNASHPDDKKQYDPKWLKAQSIWWGNDFIKFDQIHILYELDLALVKLVGLPANYVTEFPVLKDPESLHQGMSLCRLGYPFMKINTQFEPDQNRFKLEGLKPDLPQQYFPYEGMLTRIVLRGIVKPDGTITNVGPNGIVPLFIEASTPGLKGQSGGPIVDVKGNMIGMQSQTANLPLGFGDMQVDGKYMPEQFINVGLGVHVKTIIAALDKFGIKYKSESDDDGYRIIG